LKEPEHKEQETTRLNKYVANAGICSRRKADVFIAKGHVTVNDTVIKEMGYRVKKNDVVKFDGNVIEVTTDFVYFLLNKPKNTITTTSDEKGRRTVMDIMKKATSERIYPVGRLDRATTGLLMLTNDGQLAKKLSHPSHNVKKVYQVTLHKPVTKVHFDKIKKGIQLEDGPVPVDAIHYLEEKNIIGIEIHIGRNRIVRRLFEHFDYQVLKLDRVYYAGLTKKDLPRGRYRPLTEREVIMLKHFT